MLLLLLLLLLLLSTTSTTTTTATSSIFSTTSTTPFSRTIWLSRHQKGRPLWILLEQEMMWVGHMQIICTSLKTDKHASTSPLSFYSPDALPATQPRVSKHGRHNIAANTCYIFRERIQTAEMTIKVNSSGLFDRPQTIFCPFYFMMLSGIIIPCTLHNVLS